MKDFNVTLCDIFGEGQTVAIRASLQNGELRISGHTIGPEDYEYEYWYSFPEEETEKLAAVLSATDGLELVLAEQFGGKAGCRKLIEVCDRNGIHYEFFSYM